MTNGTSTVIHQHTYDFSNLAWIPQGLVAYNVVSMSVNKVAQSYFPQLEQNDLYVASLLLTGLLYYCYTAQPLLTTGATVATFIFIRAIAVLKTASKPLAPPPFLENLNEKMKDEAQVAVGNEGRIKELESKLRGLSKTNALLIGLPGIGKTTLVEGIAWLIAHNQIDPTSVFYGKTIYCMDTIRIMSFAGTVGDKEGRLQMISQFIESRSDVILFVDEIHQLVSAGLSRSDDNSIAQLLSQCLLRKNWRVIGAVPTQNYYTHIKQHPAFDRRFMKIWLHGPNDAECEQMIAHFTKSAGFVDEYPNAAISAAHIKAVIFLTNPLVKDRGQPDLAKELIENVAKEKEEGPINPGLIWTVYIRDHFGGREEHPNIQKIRQDFFQKFN